MNEKQGKPVKDALGDVKFEKSPLDEFIDTARKAYFYGCDEEEIRERAVSFPCVERLIRLAVEKHAEAIIPEEREMKVPVSFDEYSSYLASGIVNILREGMQKRSDEFRGV